MHITGGLIGVILAVVFGLVLVNWSIVIFLVGLLALVLGIIAWVLREQQRRKLDR